MSGGEGGLTPGEPEQGGESITVAGFHLTDASELVLTIVLLLTVSTLARVAFHSFEIRAVPESAVIVLLGAAAGAVFVLAGVDQDSVLTFNPDIFFLILIPPIILEAGYHLQADFFFDNISLILLYAFVGTVLNALLLGLLLWASESAYPGIAGDISILELAIFCSLISAVDPVAVLAIFETIHVNETLNILVFGESVLNDAISIVLYRLFVSLRGFDLSGFDAGIFFLGLLKFLVVAFGGVAIGIVLGCAAAFVTRFTQHIHTLEPLILILFANLAYILAEVLELSGIMSILFAGLVMSRYLEANVHKKSHVTIDYSLRIWASTAETIVFAYLGIATMFQVLTGSEIIVGSEGFPKWDAGFMLLTVFYVLPVRLFVTLGLTFIANYGRLQPIDIREQLIMAYSGLRGAIAFALAFILPDDVPAKNVFIGATLVVIWFTIFIQGTTIKFFIRKLSVALALEEADERTAPKVFSKSFDHIVDAIHLITDGYHTGWFGLMGVWRETDKFLFRILVKRERYFGQEADMLGTIATFSKYEKLLKATGGGLHPGVPRAAHREYQEEPAAPSGLPGAEKAGEEDPHGHKQMDPMRLIWHHWTVHHAEPHVHPPQGTAVAAAGAHVHPEAGGALSEPEIDSAESGDVPVSAAASDVRRRVGKGKKGTPDIMSGDFAGFTARMGQYEKVKQKRKDEKRRARRGLAAARPAPAETAPELPQSIMEQLQQHAKQQQRKEFRQFEHHAGVAGRAPSGTRHTRLTDTPDTGRAGPMYEDADPAPRHFAVQQLARRRMAGGIPDISAAKQRETEARVKVGAGPLSLSQRDREANLARFQAVVQSTGRKPLRTMSYQVGTLPLATLSPSASPSDEPRGRSFDARKSADRAKADRKRSRSGASRKVKRMASHGDVPASVAIDPKASGADRALAEPPNPSDDSRNSAEAETETLQQHRQLKEERTSSPKKRTSSSAKKSSPRAPADESAQKGKRAARHKHRSEDSSKSRSDKGSSD